MEIQAELWESDPSEEDESDLRGVQTNAVVASTDWTVETILFQLRRGNIELNSRFQRREAWTNSRKSRFIESLFLGLPVPQIILAERKDKRGSYIVIDGKQRLLSIRRFGVDDPDEEFEPLTLSDLDIYRHLNGQTWANMKGDPQFDAEVAAYENQTIRTVVVRNWPGESFLFLVFLRLNMGSVPLSPQELRQALNPGPFIDYADEFSSQSVPIRKALRLTGPDFRMRDVEILIRYLAFADSIRTYNGNLREFLDSLCRRFNNEWEFRESEIKRMAEDCNRAIDYTFEIFGSDAFRRHRSGGLFENRFNRAVFDIMTYYFRDADLSKKAVQNKEEVIKEFIRLCEADEQFNGALQSTTKSVSATFYRLQRWGELLQSILDHEIEIPKTEH